MPRRCSISLCQPSLSPPSDLFQKTTSPCAALHRIPFNKNTLCQIKGTAKQGSPHRLQSHSRVKYRRSQVLRVQARNNTAHAPALADHLAAFRHCRPLGCKPAWSDPRSTRCGKDKRYASPLHRKIVITPRLRPTKSPGADAIATADGFGSQSRALHNASGPVQSSTWHGPGPNVFAHFRAHSHKSRICGVFYDIIHAAPHTRAAIPPRKNGRGPSLAFQMGKNPREGIKVFSFPARSVK